VMVGANGAGKSTFFSVFAFLLEAMQSNVRMALAKIGGSRGFQEVRSRGATGPIEIEIKFRTKLHGEDDNRKTLITYALAIDEKEGTPYVSREILKYRRGSKGQSWHFLDFSNGEGEAVTNAIEQIQDESELHREKQKLKSPDILAIKGLSQFEKFPAVVALGDLIEQWHLSDFHINRARNEPEIAFADHLSKDGDNLALVIDHFYAQHRPVFDHILEQLKHRIPGIANIDAKHTEEGRVLLRFQDGAFADPFLARHVSDGTIKMLAYLVLLNDPKPYSLLCIEEPENQLYPSLLQELAEEFRAYADRGGQIFISTHSPELLNAVRPEEVYWLVKKDGHTQIFCAADDEQIKAYIAEGEQMGYLWKTGCIPGVDPQ
jgi:predicted ATPase